LAPFTTFGIGGPAELLVEATRGDELAEIAAGRGADLHVLGGGSNVLIADGGLSGTTAVLRGRFDPVDLNVDADGLVVLDAAWDWPSVATALAAAGIQGTESMCGIPGTVGGAVVQNIGAYGYELADVIHEVVAYDRAEGRRMVLAPRECGFGYRTSRFKGADRGRLLVLGVTLLLAPGRRHEVRYEELGEELSGAGSDLCPESVCRAVLAIRERKAMVFHPGDPATRGVGSFFTNPIITSDHLERLSSQHPGEIPHWPAEAGVKLSAAWLIERAGYPRGGRIGSVGISEKHALAILNLGGDASAAEVVEFAAGIRRRVLDTHGVLLTPEPVFLGFGDDDPLS
jgi:UDP-N-acetylmuramate dehydrogenase